MKGKKPTDKSSVYLLHFRHSHLQLLVSNFPFLTLWRLKETKLSTYGFHSWIHLSQTGSWWQKTTGSFSGLVVPTGRHSNIKKDSGVGEGHNRHHTSHRSRFPAYIRLRRLKTQRREGPWAPRSGAGEAFPTTASHGSLTPNNPADRQPVWAAGTAGTRCTLTWCNISSGLGKTPCT